MASRCGSFFIYKIVAWIRRTDLFITTFGIVGLLVDLLLAVHIF